ncbi:MAG: FAD-dependent monooxygenase, partial [Gammaproteobacteria bacterium]
VGAALANLLGEHGVSTLVIDRAADIYLAPRAIALDNEALRILQLAGLSEDAFERIAIPTVRLHSPAFGHFARIDSCGETDGHPRLVTFHQPDLERALRARLTARQSVTTWTSTELVDFEETTTGVSASLRTVDGVTRRVAASYLVGADGASSLVRKRIGQEFAGRTYAEDWLIVDALDIPTPIDHVEFSCDPARPAVHMCAPGGRQRWEFMLRRGESAATMERDDSVRALLAPWVGNTPVTIERRAVYRFHARAVDAFSRGRVFLVGDAAHVTPPFAGQGLVAGLRDAANLGWKLAWVVQGRADAAMLASYDRERRPHAKAMIGLAQFLGRLIMPRSIVAAGTIHGGIRALRLLPAMRRWFDNLGMKPKNEYTDGLFVSGGARGPLVRGGLLPQGWLRTPDGALLASDEVLGGGFCLVGFGRDPGPHLDDEARAALAAVGGRCVPIAHRGQHLERAPGVAAAEDIADALVPGGAPAGWAAIVRPDRIVMHHGPVEEASRLVRESLALLGTPRGAGELRAATP